MSHASTANDIPQLTDHKSLLAEGLNQEIDHIFDQLVPDEAQRNVSDRKAIQSLDWAATQEDSLSEMSFAPPTIEHEGTASELSSGTRDEAVSGLPAVDQSMPTTQGISNEVPVIIKKSMEIKEFGRLSSKATLREGKPVPAGTMKTVGKLLVDVQAIENIIKGGETGKLGSGLASARVISAARGEGINALLAKIDDYPDVNGCLIVGNDGLVIASTVVSDMDRDALGALSAGLLHTSNLATLRLEIGKLGQMVLLTEFSKGDDLRTVTTILTDVEVGVLAVFLETQKLDALDGLLERIHATVHG
jgi:predicted regulator of Ras-like GTPase activity (Roadblock/LC7/MglB family)